MQNIKGISYVYAAFTDISLDYEKWPKPTSTNSEIVNIKTSESHLIHISSENIKKFCKNIVSCGVVISVEGGVGTSDNNNEYSIKVYSNIAWLIEKTP